MRIGTLLLVVTLFTALGATQVHAKDESCVDGVNCLCDKISQVDSGVVFCEDFEEPSLDGNGGTTGWTDKYGAPVDGCWASPYGRNTEGTCPTCCVNVVKETGCEVASQTDCVFQGAQALGHRFRPGATQGAVGSKQLRAGSHFGVTMAVKFSRNFFNTDAPKKTNEFGPSLNCVLGCSSGTIVSQTAGNPYHGSFFMTSLVSGATALRGRIHSNETGFRWAANVSSEYEFNRDFGVDRWHCRQFHVTNIGKNGARIRDWIDGKLLVDVSNVDLSRMRDAAIGMNGVTFNNYVNGGYAGSTIAYRYEDNLVVTTSSEPVSCAAIGFGTIGSSDPGPVGAPTPIGEPGRPTLVP